MEPRVSIIMGSTSDLGVMEAAAKVLDEFEIPFEINALSAHRTPQRSTPGPVPPRVLLYERYYQPTRVRQLSRHSVHHLRFCQMRPYYPPRHRTVSEQSPVCGAFRPIWGRLHRALLAILGACRLALVVQEPPRGSAVR